MRDIPGLTQRERVVLHEYFQTGKIRTKRAFYMLYNKGLLGNRPKIYGTLSEALSSSYDGTFTIRVAIPGWVGIYKLPKVSLSSEVEKLLSQGISERDISFNQSMDDNRLVLQGEIIDIPHDDSKGIVGGLYLTYSTVKKPMKIGLKEQSFHVKDGEVVSLLQKHLSLESQRELQWLVNSFPNHAVEFSVYECEVGDLPNRNTIIWEVRAY